jgi:TolA-binding protein
MHPLFPAERELELTAELLRSVAKAYQAKLATASAEQAKLLTAKTRASLRRAGLAFSKLAELHTASRTYTDDLWNAAECFSQGHDYRHAVASLDLYLKYELRRRRSSALLLLGEATFALGETDKALTTLQECIDAYPNEPACYPARVLAAKVWIEKGDTAKAELLLQANLEDNNLTPRSLEWRDSLFGLGSLLVVVGRYQDAIQRLEEFVARYPDSPQALEARYLTAQADQHLGQQLQQKLADEKIETLRSAHEKQMQQNLIAAIERYQQLQALLGHRAEQSELNKADKAILRNSRFALAASLFDLGRYEEAARTYSNIASGYRNEPEALDAFVQLAACYRRLNQPAEVQGALSQAKSALERMNKDADFKLTTNHSRLEWGQLLDQLAVL